MAIAWWVATGLGLVGCASDGPKSPLAELVHVRSRGVERRVQADWNDVEAAVDLALSESEMASVAIGDGAADRLTDALEEWASNEDAPDQPDSVYTVRFMTVDGIEGALLARREPFAPRAVERPEMIQILVRVGRRGDALREQRLADETVRRLESLRGVATKPGGGVFGW